MHFIFPLNRIMVLSRMCHHKWGALSCCRSAYRGVTRFSGEWGVNTALGELPCLGDFMAWCFSQKGEVRGFGGAAGHRASHLPSLGLPLGKGRGALFLRCDIAPIIISPHGHRRT